MFFNGTCAIPTRVFDRNFFGTFNAYIGISVNISRLSVVRQTSCVVVFFNVFQQGGVLFGTTVGLGFALMLGLWVNCYFCVVFSIIFLCAVTFIGENVTIIKGTCTFRFGLCYHLRRFFKNIFAIAGNDINIGVPWGRLIVFSYLAFLSVA